MLDGEGGQIFESLPLQVVTTRSIVLRTWSTLDICSSYVASASIIRRDWARANGEGNMGLLALRRGREKQTFIFILVSEQCTYCIGELDDVLVLGSSLATRWSTCSSRVFAKG